MTLNTPASTTTTASSGDPWESFPLPARRIADLAELHGWIVTLAADSFAVAHPQRPDRVAFQVSVEPNGVKYREPQRRPNAAAVRRAVKTGIHEPPRMVLAKYSRIEELAMSACLPEQLGVCRCCQTPSPPELELTLSGTGLCWSCHRTHSDLAGTAFFRHDAAAACASEHRHGRRDPDTASHGTETWRLDPRASVTDNQDHLAADFKSWASERGVPNIYVWEHNFGFDVGLEHERGEDPVFGLSVYDGWWRSVLTHRRHCEKPFRHEALAMLRAAQATLDALG